MGQERLSDLALINIELPPLLQTEKINYEEIIDAFAKAKNRRTDFF
jgi:hypothetical protein